MSKEKYLKTATVKLMIPLTSDLSGYNFVDSYEQKSITWCPFTLTFPEHMQRNKRHHLEQMVTEQIRKSTSFVDLQSLFSETKISAFESYIVFLESMAFLN